MDPDLSELEFIPIGPYLVQQIPQLKDNLLGQGIRPDDLKIVTLTKRDKNNPKAIEQMKASFRSWPPQKHGRRYIEWQNIINYVVSSDEGVLIGFFIKDRLCGLVNCDTFFDPRNVIVDATERPSKIYRVSDAPASDNPLKGVFTDCTIETLNHIAKLSGQFDRITCVAPNDVSLRKLRALGFEELKTAKTEPTRFVRTIRPGLGQPRS